jgi:hypothetical protein
MLKRYLPNEGAILQPPLEAAWTRDRYDAATALILRIRELHDADLPALRPHAELIELTGASLSEPELAHSLERGWGLAREVSGSPASPSPHARHPPCAIATRHAIRAADCGDCRGTTGRVGCARARGCGDPTA